MTALHSELADLYYGDQCQCPDCIQLTDDEKKKTPRFQKKYYDAAVKHVHDNGGYKPSMILDDPIKDLLNETNRILDTGMRFGIKDNVIPQKLKEALTQNVRVFSGIKTNAQLVEVGKLLLTEDGKRKQFDQFAKDVEAIHENYNRDYLEAEYQFATHSAQMASNWSEIEKDGDDYDLQYRTAGDAQVRASHAALDNTTLPPSDPFWEEYCPPNGWKCRCKTQQVRKGKYARSDSDDSIAKGEKATTQTGKDGENKLAIFRFNPGKQGAVFPPKHPYDKVKGAATVKKALRDE